MKATEKQKEFLTSLIKELEILRDSGTNDPYWYAELEKFAMCSIYYSKILNLEQSVKLAGSLDKILDITRELK